MRFGMIVKPPMYVHQSCRRTRSLWASPYICANSPKNLCHGLPIHSTHLLEMHTQFTKSVLYVDRSKHPKKVPCSVGVVPSINAWQLKIAACAGPPDMAGRYLQVPRRRAGMPLLRGPLNLSRDP